MFDDELGPICILTPTGMQCMSSPVKTHEDHADCAPTTDELDAYQLQLYQLFAPLVLNNLVRHKSPTEKRKETLVITKALILMMSCSVLDPDNTFALIKRSGLASRVNWDEKWNELVNIPA
jgi:hypothetical protein